MQCNRSSEVEC